MAYENPARAVAECRRKGKRTPGEIYECAIGRMPHEAPNQWARVARRLATEQGTFDGARGRRKKPTRRRPRQRGKRRGRRA